jgi:hypothetical protein
LKHVLAEELVPALTHEHSIDTLARCETRYREVALEHDDRSRWLIEPRPPVRRCIWEEPRAIEANTPNGKRSRHSLLDILLIPKLVVGKMD